MTEIKMARDSGLPTIDFYRYRIVLTGGGTGGHIMPLLAVAEAYQNYPADLLYIGSRGGREEYLAREHGIDFRGIFTGKWRRYNNLSAWGQNVVDIFRLMIGCIQALVILMTWRPQVIMAKGGYVSLPVIVAGWLLRIPLLTHESDAVMGVTNRLAYKLASRVATGFPLANYCQDRRGRLVFTGIPVQAEFYNTRIHKEDYAFFHFNPRVPVILVTGGIQGARAINAAIKEILPKMLERWQVIHLAGEADYPDLEQFGKTLGGAQERYALFPVLGEERAAAVRIAALVISRASATTLAELALAAKPVILVPLANAASDHQTKNARVYEKSGAAVVIEEKRLTGRKLYETMKSLMRAPAKRQKMGKAIRALAVPAAKETLREELLKLARAE